MLVRHQPVAVAVVVVVVVAKAPATKIPTRHLSSHLFYQEIVVTKHICHISPIVLGIVVLVIRVLDTTVLLLILVAIQLIVLFLSQLVGF
jgi:hypothetical protein